MLNNLNVKLTKCQYLRRTINTILYTIYCVPTFGPRSVMKNYNIWSITSRIIGILQCNVEMKFNQWSNYDLLAATPRQYAFCHIMHLCVLYHSKNKTDYFPTQHELIGIVMDVICALCEVKTEFLYRAIQAKHNPFSLSHVSGGYSKTPFQQGNQAYLFSRQTISFWNINWIVVAQYITSGLF